MTKQPVPPPKAAALKYDGENAPVMVAKGSGELAKQIIEEAKANDVHIHNDPTLIEVLSRLELGDEIPENLYLAVAKIIAFAYFLQGKHPENCIPNHNQPETKLSLCLEAPIEPEFE